MASAHVGAERNMAVGTWAVPRVGGDGGPGGEIEVEASEKG